MKDLLDVVGYNKNEKTSSDISRIESSKCDSFSTCPLSKTPQLSKGMDIRGVIMDSDNNVSFGESTILLGYVGNISQVAGPDLLIFWRLGSQQGCQV